MSDDPDEKARQRRALGRLLMECGEILSDDEKRARIEARIYELREQIGSDPRRALDLAQTIANALKGRR